jgi:hypothetical protein
MNSLATVSVSACSDFIEKGTVHFVHLGTVDFGKTVSHNVSLNYKIL